MLDPRIYRAALLPIVLALIVVGFSLQDQPRPVTTTLSADAFDGDGAFRQLERLVALAPDRAPGSAGDRAVAAVVARSLRDSGFAVDARTVTARTGAGRRQVRLVLGERTGFSSRRLLVVAQRDATGPRARAQLSGTAALLELARVLGVRTLERTLVLASVSGGADAVAALARDLGGSVDAVLVLGDVAGTATARSLVVPWGDGAAAAPPRLWRTVASALAAEAELRARPDSVATQFARLAFPLATGPQAPFVGAGVPAVLVSASGERPPAADAPVSVERLGGFGRAALRALTALDGGPPLPAPAAALAIERKLLPAWSVRLLALALIVPVLLAAVDGWARVRRRGERVGRWVGWVAACALPFALAVLLARVLGVAGLAAGVPAAGAGTESFAREGAALAALASVVVLAALGWIALRPRLARALGADDPSSPGAAAAVVLVLCALTTAVWVVNPFAALLLVPALHLWLLAVAPETRVHPLAALAMFAVGLVPPVLIALAYARLLALDALELATTGVLLVAGGGVGLVDALAWAVALGCAGAVLAIVVRTAGGGPEAERPVTVRGPRTYAGPGSLGGTESALRR